MARLGWARFRGFGRDCFVAQSGSRIGPQPRQRIKRLAERRHAASRACARLRAAADGARRRWYLHADAAFGSRSGWRIGDAGRSRRHGSILVAPFFAVAG
jgi:hypothetical protein